MSDLLWSDPSPFMGRSPSKRGVGQAFGPDVTAAFLDSNGLQMLIRSHEVKEEGYLVEHDGKVIFFHLNFVSYFIFYHMTKYFTYLMLLL